jgi:hypothetical protein
MFSRFLPRLAVAALIGLAPASGLHALEVLSAETLAGYCAAGEGEAEQPGEQCMTYVHGFVDGAVATDPQVTLNVTRELQSAEEFTEQALSERVGARIARYGPSVYADFCVPQPAPLWEITDHVIRELRRSEDLGEPAREVVYRALRGNYPCV